MLLEARRQVGTDQLAGQRAVSRGRCARTSTGSLTVEKYAGAHGREKLSEGPFDKTSSVRGPDVRGGSGV